MAFTHPPLIELGPGISIAFGLPTLGMWDTQTRPKKPKRGTLGFNYQTNHLEYWSGSNWFAAAMSAV